MSWQRQILRVNLSKGECTIEPLNMEWAENYLGQRGLGSKYLLEEMDPAADALSAENTILAPMTLLTRNFKRSSPCTIPQTVQHLHQRLLKELQEKRRAEMKPEETVAERKKAKAIAVADAAAVDDG